MLNTQTRPSRQKKSLVHFIFGEKLKQKQPGFALKKP